MLQEGHHGAHLNGSAPDAHALFVSNHGLAGAPLFEVILIHHQHGVSHPGAAQSFT
jgi:hypothetical protein